MALNAKTIAAGVGDILNVDGGLTGSPKRVVDGDGTGSPIYVSTAAVGISATTPAAPLHIKANASHNNLILEENSGGQTFMFRIDTNGHLQLFPGSTSDLTSGAANNIVILNTGKVGIGGITPAYELDVDGSVRIKNNNYLYGLTSGDANGVLIGMTSGNNINVGQSNANNVALNLYGGTGHVNLFAASTQVATFQTDGQVGIGTNSPGNLLHVSNSAAGGHAAVEITRGNTAGSAKVIFSSADDGYSDWEAGSVDSDDFVDGTDFGIGTTLSAANVKLVIKSSGRVGIGATDPVSELEVRGDTSTPGSIITISTADTAIPGAQTIGSLNFQAPKVSAGGDSQLVSAYVRAVTQAEYSSTVNSTALEFGTGKSEAAATKMWLDEDGYVGIGESNPGFKLDVLESSGNEIARFSGANSGTLTFRNDTSNMFTMYTGTGDSLVFGTGGDNDRMNIDASGIVEFAHSIKGTHANQFDLYMNTTNGSDNKRLRIGGGGDVVKTRGAYATFHGNEHASSPGDLFLPPGAEGGVAGDVIVENGNVGIGIPSPTAILHLKESTASTTAATDMLTIDAYSDGTSAVGFGSSIAFRGERHDNNVQNMAKISAITEVNAGGVMSSALTFQTGIDGALGERVRIDNTGNIGIGIDDPKKQLHLHLDGGGTIALTTIDTVITDGDYLGQIYFGANYGTHSAATSYGALIRAEAAEEWDTDNVNQAPTELQFWTSDDTSDAMAQRMVITRDGNIGIGIDNPSGMLHLRSTTASSSPILYLENTNANNDGGVLKFLKNPASDEENDDDALGSIQFTGQDDGDTHTNYVRITAESRDVSAATKSGRLTFYNYQAGNSRNILDIKATPGVDTGSVIINEDGRDVDFIVESDTNTHALFVRGSDGNVGIGLDSPASLLHVKTSAINNQEAFLVEASDGDDLFRIHTDSDGDPNIQMMDKDGNTDVKIDTAADTYFNGGDVGIGTTSPDAKLEVSGSFAANGPSSTFVTFADGDATPSVATGNIFKHHASTETITMFDDGVCGQKITVISTAAITYDVTGTNLKGGNTDLVTANGEVTEWVFDGTYWYLIGYMDLSEDYN